MESSSAKLASGSRINSAKDDAAGLAMTSNLKAQKMGLRQAYRNANDAVSYLQVAEGGIAEQANLLPRLRELALRSASDTVSDAERDIIEYEYRELSDEIQRIAESTRYADEQLLAATDGDYKFRDFQIGLHHEASSQLSLGPLDLLTDDDHLGISTTSTWNKEDAQQGLAYIDEAINELSGQRSFLGSYQASLSSSMAHLETQIETTAAAHGRIADADYAVETAANIGAKLKVTAAARVMVDANNFSASALKLLK